MAERRMFAKTIIDSDAFLDMPQSSQLLYFHLSMRADDDGFVNNAKSISRNVGCKDDDFKILSAKKFIIPFESGIVVIKHWKIHNYIQNDRYHETKYKNEKSILFLDENNSYTTNVKCIQDVSKMDTEGMDTEVRVRLVKDSLGKDKYNDEFLSFWELYPRKDNKKASSKSFATVRKTLSLPNILDRLEIYKRKIEVEKIRPQYIRMAATFLNNIDDYVIDSNHNIIRSDQPKKKLPPCPVCGTMSDHENCEKCGFLVTQEDEELIEIAKRRYEESKKNNG